jgi:hypothetical protein
VLLLLLLLLLGWQDLQSVHHHWNSCKDASIRHKVIIAQPDWCTWLVCTHPQLTKT